MAKNPACPPSLLRTLGRDSAQLVRGVVASNPNCPIELLLTLANDAQWTVRANAADNKNLPLGTLEKLSLDDERTVRANVAKNPACPPSLLKTLGDDIVSDVRRAVAENAGTPIRLLADMLVDDDDGVCLVAILSLGNMDAAAYARTLSEGLGLSTSIGPIGHQKQFGEALLDAGLTDAYQHIQAAEMANKIRDRLIEAPDAAETIQISKMRM